MNYHRQFVLVTVLPTDCAQSSRSAPGQSSLGEHDEAGQEEDTNNWIIKIHKKLVSSDLLPPTQPYTDPHPLCGPAYMVAGVHRHSASLVGSPHFAGYISELRPRQTLNHQITSRLSHCSYLKYSVLERSPV